MPPKPEELLKIAPINPPLAPIIEKIRVGVSSVAPTLNVIPSKSKGIKIKFFGVKHFSFYLEP